MLISPYKIRSRSRSRSETKNFMPTSHLRDSADAVATLNIKAPTGADKQKLILRSV